MDLNGVGFFKDSAIFANFLEVKYGPLKDPAVAREVAQAILADFSGTAYYQNIQHLSSFLEQKFNYTRQ